MINYGSCLAFIRSKKVADKYRLWSNLAEVPKVYVKSKGMPMSVEIQSKIMELHAQGKPFIDIATVVKCHPNTVSKYIKRNEIQKKSKAESISVGIETGKNCRKSQCAGHNEAGGCGSRCTAETAEGCEVGGMPGV